MASCRSFTMLSLNIFIALFIYGVAATDFSTFSDSKCAASLDNINGPNGYPNGTCTPLNLKNNTSFQLVAVDDGCAVTLYGPDTTSDPCSAEILKVARVAECYNSSWVYYSIDGCDIPSPIPSSKSSSSKSLPTSTQSTSSLYSTITITAATASASAGPSSTPQSANHTGVIVGGAVGGVAALALVAIAILLFLRKRKPTDDHPPFAPTYEMSNDRQRVEIPHSEKTVQTEMYAHDAALEMGRNSAYIPPQELSGDAVPGQDRKYGVSDKYRHAI